MFDSSGNLNLNGDGSASENHAQLINQVANLAPLATQYHGPMTGVPIAQAYTPPVVKAPSGFAHWIGGTAGQIGNIAVGVAKWAGNTTADMGKGVWHFGGDLGHVIIDVNQTKNIGAQTDALGHRLTNLHNLYSSGKISRDQYKKGLFDYNTDANNLVSAVTANTKKTNMDTKNTVLDGIKTASAITTILTAGSGASVTDPLTASAARFLASEGADASLAPAVAKLGQLTVDKSMFEGLTSTAQQAVQKATAEIVASAAPGQTAGEIARAAVVNLAFKYPLYYSYLSGTGTSLYEQLDNAKYGSAVEQLAFNAALMLSGGPIGYAVKRLGQGVGIVKDVTFGRSSFLDEMSKGTGNGDPAGYIKEAVNPETPEAYKFIDDNGNVTTKKGADLTKAIVHNYSTLEEVNVNRVRGRNPVTGAWKVLNGMASYTGTTMADVSHAEASVSMNNFTEAFRLAANTGKKLGMGIVTVGRTDARSLSQIAKTVAEALPSGKQAALDAWEALKTQNYTWAYSHNPNFDRQIKALIDAHGDPGALETEIKSIKAGMTVKGFPKDVAAKLAQLGYVPIKPTSIEAPFREGKGAITTKFGQGEDFFIKAVQPLPVLEHVGTMLTGAGLSPEASSDRVYQMFNSNLTDNLNRLGITGKIADQLGQKEAASAAKTAEAATDAQIKGLTADEAKMLEKAGVTPDVLAKASITGTEAAPRPTAEVKSAMDSTRQTSDFAMKTLSNYAKNPTRGKISGLAPITDFRMMGKQDIVQAFKDRGITINIADAHAIQDAISQAYIQVPRFVRGLGDRVVDRTYQVPAIGSLFGKYLRLQGAVRFAWNPFFQYLRVIPKTEFLSMAEGGGFTSSVFMGRTDQINDIRDFLRTNGYLDAKGRLGTVISGEAVDFAGTSTRNLSKKLLPMQERSIAGLIDSQAQRVGMDWETYIRAYPEQTRDTIQMIAEYDRRSSFLNSPLARTMNIAIFPFRFEAKVLGITVRSLARTSLMTQVAVVNGMFKLNDFMNSPEGMAWYSQHANAIGLFKYISPLASLNEVFKSLLPGHDHSLGNFGELGGLPFGWLTQILDGQGITHINQPGVDAATGNLFSTYIPATQRGQVAIAIQDFLNTMFSYPGATIGLPSKNSITRGAALAVTKANKKTDLQLNTPALSDLSKQQQNYVHTIQGLSATTPLNQTAPPVQVGPKVNPQVSAPNQVNPGLSVPALPTPATTPLPRKGRLTAKSAKSSKLKKSQFTPQLLPGQSSLGQL